MSEESTQRYLRLRLELIVALAAEEELTAAALRQIGAEQDLPIDEREHAVSAVEEDGAEALAYLVDPFTVVGGVPGIELVQASWQCEHTDYGPESEDWEFYDE